jgi:tRNA/rRNA methyltransferase
MAELGVVLHKPRMADNVGGVARAMANFGYRRLVLSEPATWKFDPRAAVKAEHVLEEAFLARSFEEAVGAFSWVCGTTSRRIRRRAALSPRELAEEVHARIGEGQNVAVVLGSENHGLTDRDLERCDAICRVATVEAQPSINLAQAAAILLQEIHAATPRPKKPPRKLAEPATRDEVERLFEVARQALLDVGFLNTQQPEHMVAELRRLLTRASPTRREVELLTAAARQVLRAVVPVKRRK